MIIESKFTDRYDFLCHQFRDEKVIYKRSRSKITRHTKENTFNTNFLKYSDLITNLTYDHIVRGYDNYKYQFDIGAVAVGSKLFQYIRTYNAAYTYSFSYDKVKQIAMQRLDDEIHSRKSGTYYSYRQLNDIIKEVDEMLVIKDDTWIKKLREITSVPIVRIERDLVIENECLNDVQCPLDSYSAYMELMSFLQSSTPSTDPGDDYDALDAHGFDRFSFKREPGGPTRKRKKLNEN